MNKLFLLSLILIISILLLIFFKGNYFLDIKTLKYFFDIQKNYFIVFFIIIYFLTPLPVTPVILLNGYYYGFAGFFIVYPIILMNSLLLFLLANHIMKINFFKKHIYKNEKILKLKNISQNDYTFIVSRYILPFFFHNLFYGILGISLKKFLYLITIFEIPLTYSLIMLGNSLGNLNIGGLNFNQIFFSKDFMIPFVIVVIFSLIIKHIYKRL